MLDYLFLYLLMVNVVGILMMYMDKKKAKKGQYRIPEKTLWLVALFGGAVGATIGMQWFRHKTKHKNFKWGLPALSIFEAVIVIYLVL